MGEQSLQNVLATALATMSLDLDMKGGAEWAPSRNPKADYSQWGPYEAWLYCRIGKINPCLVGPVPTGDWICWNSQTGQIMGFTNKSTLTAQQQAEILAVSQNQGKPTRVVNPFGAVTASVYTLREVEKMLQPALRDFEQQRSEQQTQHPDGDVQ